MEMGTADAPRVTSQPTDEASDLYDPSEVRTYELRIDPEALAFLDADPRAETYVPAALVFEGKRYGPVGVRYKGSVGAFRGCTERADGGAKTCRKLSLKVSFDWQDPDARFHGLKKLLFHAMQRDPSKMRDRLGYWMFREAGVPSPRMVHARLRINGEYAGVYALVEEIDGRFTRSRFADGEGNLYKEIWPMTSLGTVPSDAAMTAGLQTNRDEEPSVARFRGFAEGLSSGDLAQRVATLEQWTDMDATLRYVAMDRAQANDDGAFHWYCTGDSCFNHNFFWYEEVDSDRMWVIPWDLDSTFNLNNEITTIWLDWEDRTPGCGTLSSPGFGALRVPTCDKVIQAWASLQQRYIDALRGVLDGPFAPGMAEERLDQWEAQIYPHLNDEAALHADTSIDDWNVARGALRGAIEVLRERLRMRIERGLHERWAGPEASLDEDAGI
jgi:spore coat protein CotH